MTKAIRLRSGWIVNGLLFCLNLLLLAVWVFTWLLPRDEFAAGARKGAAALGMEMEVYCARRPFAILVKKGFPENQTFVVYEHGQPFLLQAAYEKGNGAKPPTQTVAATVRADRSSPTFSVSFAYDPANPREISDLRFQKKGVTLYDMNADGTFDMRLTLGAEPRGELWYKGKSQEQDMHDQGASAYRRRLVGGEVLLFDMKNGLWRPESEKSAPGKDAPR